MSTLRRDTTSRPRIGLALSGGSTWGLAHIGVLKALSENKIPIHCIAGTSAGALAAVFYAFDIPIVRMTELAKNLSWKEFSRFAFSRFGFSTNKLMEEFLKRELGDVRIEDAKIPLAIVATNIETGERVAFRAGKVSDAVRASTSIPGVFTPVEIDGVYYVDGGITERLPLSPLHEMGADITIGVHLSARLPTLRPRDVRDVLMRSISILSRVRDTYATELADILIAPELSRFIASDFSSSELLQEAGYEAAIEKIPEIKRKIAAHQSWIGRISSKVVSWLRRN